uniref:Uncharacterized protein n=1 Tax=Acrobeloides nanus TaxID=290746 RepID=A0A914CLY0_9BILA
MSSSVYIPLVNDSKWASKENIAEIDAIVSDLTDSIDDMGALLTPIESWRPAKNKFPLDPVTYETNSAQENCNEGASTSYEAEKSNEVIVKHRIKPEASSNNDDKEIRRWSMLSTSSAVRPPDAASCDCAAMAFASLRKGKRRRQRMLRYEEEYYHRPSTATIESPPDSPDSGISSAASSECSSSRSFEENGCPLPLPNGERLIEKKNALTRKSGYSRYSLRLMFGSVFRRLLYASKKSPFISIEVRILPNKSELPHHEDLQNFMWKFIFPFLLLFDSLLKF